MKIISAEVIDEQQVYDIGLEKDHNFVLSNGMVVHNCFNSSHSAAYALVTYWTMWMRHYYPIEFMASMFNTFLTKEDKLTQLINEAKKSGIKVKMPDFRYSKYECFVEEDKSIRLGFGVIKGVSETIDEYVSMYRAKEYDPNNFVLVHYYSIGNKKIMSKRNMEALIYAGAFDYLGVHRSKLSKTYEFFEENVSKKYKNKDGMLRYSFMKECVLIDDSMYEKESNEILETKQFELMPFKSFGSKLEGYEHILYDKLRLTSIEGLQANGTTCKVPGIISNVKTKKDKNNKEMAFITIEDSYGSSMRAPIFSYLWPTIKEECFVGRGVCLEGKAEEYNGRVSFKVTKVSQLRKILLLASSR